MGLGYADYVVTDSQFIHLADVENLLGDSNKAQREFGRIYTLIFDDLVHEVVEEDINLLRKQMERYS